MAKRTKVTRKVNGKNTFLGEMNPFSKKEDKEFRNNCMFQGVVKCCGRICCDSIGDDMSPEFCNYCQYISKTYKLKPYKVAEKLYECVGKLIKILNAERTKKQEDK